MLRFRRLPFTEIPRRQTELSVPSIPSLAPGGILYPTEYDDFLPQWTSSSYMVAADFLDLFNAVVAMQSELGLFPGGKIGSVRDRLTLLDNINVTNATYKRTEWGFATVSDNRNLNYNEGSPTSTGYRIPFSKVFTGVNNLMGDGVPAVFLACGDALPISFGTERAWSVGRVSSQHMDTEAIVTAAHTASSPYAVFTSGIATAIQWLAVNWRM